MTNFTKVFSLLILALISYTSLGAQTLEGKVVDSATGEPLIGVTVVVKGTTKGISTDVDGTYSLAGIAPKSVLQVSYISYKTIETAPLNIKAGSTETMNFSLESDDLQIESVQVVAKKNVESEGVLKNERIQASFALENLGAKEMSIKGISNASEGVKKMSSVTESDGGQVFVRGLGDRYSLTTLNGLPIASPNANNKLISLDLFPSSIIGNITVSKVYSASSFADYSGARIDITTKENTGSDFFSISLSAGGQIGTMFNNIYSADNAGVFNSQKLPSAIADNNANDYIASTSGFTSYLAENNIFETSFDVTELTALPDFSATIAGGKNWKFNALNSLSLIASLSSGKSTSSTLDKTSATYNYQAVKMADKTTDEYSQKFKISGLVALSYSYKGDSKVSYTSFYTRALDDKFGFSHAWNDEAEVLTSNSSREINTLFTNQVLGKHTISDKFALNYAASYGVTSSDAPDRRQVTYDDNGDGTYSLRQADQNNTNRFYSTLSEDEIIGDVNSVYTYGDKNTVKLGFAYKDKNREYNLTKFTYNLSNVTSQGAVDIYNIGNVINYDAIKSGTISVKRYNGSTTSYTAGLGVYAPYLEADYNVAGLLVNLGARMEYAKMWADYTTETGVATLTTLNSLDVFPTLNLKYSLPKSQTLRFGSSYTVTRPSFYEIAEFLYEPEYGGDEIIGNADLKNGYNINLDLKYEYFVPNSSDMFSVTAYYKILQDPIEQVQRLSGSTIQQTYKNADDGSAAGVELEIRKGFLKHFTVGFNASYMYTNVNLSDDLYTDSNRMLQGASPYLINADLTFNKKFKGESSLTMALLYNLQGKRISSVGLKASATDTEGMANTMQEDYHTLNFNISYNINSHWSVKAGIDNILDSESTYTQEMLNGETKIVKSYKEGMDVSVGISYNF
ncbi:MAG: TonB-dependent receptor [Rikenellaceae bacterium]